MKIAIASDHAGVELKEAIKTYLKNNNHEAKDLGPFDNKSVDYPDYAHPLADAVEKGEVEMGIAICGSGNGINMTANKHQGIRAALCWNAEIAQLAKSHNNANIISMPARYVSTEQALEMLETFINTEFEGGRHQGRIDKISCSC